MGMEHREGSATRTGPAYWTLSGGVFASLFYLFWARTGVALRALIFAQILLDVVLVGNNCHNGTEQVVRQQMSPDFLVDHVGRLAAEDVHLHG